MSRAKQRFFSEAWSDLLYQRDNGKPVPPKPPVWLMASNIKTWPEVFQHRRPAKFVSEAHIRELARGAKARGELDPIIVWWDGKRWACIDGHHRLLAYSQAGMMRHDVPVQFLRAPRPRR